MSNISLAINPSTPLDILIELSKNKVDYIQRDAKINRIKRMSLLK